MNLHELIETAILDAMGLLEQDEQAQFDAAFRRAAPAVQAQVRREQTRLAMIDDLLPDVMPPAGLRAAVLDAVRRQMLASESDGVAGSITPPMIRSTGVSAYWRMGALGMAAAVVIVGLTALQTHSQFREFRDLVGRDRTLQVMIEKLGASYVKGVLFGPDTRRVVFKPAGSGARGEASVFYNPDWSHARLYHDGLNTGDDRTFKLAIVDDQDQVVKVLHVFHPTTEGFGSASFAMPAPPTNGGKLAIFASSPEGTYQLIERGEWTL